MLTDEAIDAAREVARKTFRRSQSQIRGQQITASDNPEWHFARAIEVAATEPLLQRIAELERQLDEARKDAERYRWLRDVASGDVWGRIGNVYAPDETDEAIDEAMQKGQS